jgi:hypothetical protein
MTVSYAPRIAPARTLNSLIKKAEQPRNSVLKMIAARCAIDVNKNSRIAGNSREIVPDTL